MRLLYTALFYLAIPAVLLRLRWRGRSAPAYRQRWAERFACYDTPATAGALWLHAVSVGEAEAAFPLVNALMRRFPDRPIVVTTTTPTGSARVRAMLGQRVQHVYLPYDVPDCVARFLNHFSPVLAVIMETEIWPNLFLACKARGIPLAIVNARLSARSARGYGRLSALAARSLSAVGWIGAQTQADAERFRAIGAVSDRIEVMGNIKFDLVIPPELPEQAGSMRARYFGSRPIWIAGSTHDGEESVILRVFQQVRSHIPDVLLILVPRHPERFDGVCALCAEQGLTVVRRSENRPVLDTDVFVVDSMGELRLFYAVSDLAFVGGSLVPTGGHNMLEPAALGRAVLFGPHTFNFADASQQLVDAGGAVRVTDADDLAHWVTALMEDPIARDTIAAKALQFVEHGKGALARAETALTRLLGADAGA